MHIVSRYAKPVAESSSGSTASSDDGSMSCSGTSISCSSSAESTADDSSSLPRNSAMLSDDSEEPKTEENGGTDIPEIAFATMKTILTKRRSVFIGGRRIPPNVALKMCSKKSTRKRVQKKSKHPKKSTREAKIGVPVRQSRLQLVVLHDVATQQSEGVSVGSGVALRHFRSLDPREFNYYCSVCFVFYVHYVSDTTRFSLLCAREGWYGGYVCQPESKQRCLRGPGRTRVSEVPCS